MRIGKKSGASRRRTAGITLIELVIALSIVTTALTASAGALVSTITAAKDAERLGRAAVFLETVMEDLSAQSYADLPSYNGNHVVDAATESASNFAADVTVFAASVDLLQVDVALTDRTTNEVIGRSSTLRARR